MHVTEIVFVDTISVAWSDHAGSWRCCLRLEVVSSIPIRTTIIHRFLCGFLCDSLCHTIKIKPIKMHITSANVQFEINTHGCWNWHLCIQDGLSVVQCSLGHIIGILFIDTISVTWSDRAGKLAELPQPGGCELNPHGSTIIYQFLCGFIRDSLCHRIKMKPTKMYIACTRAQLKINTHRYWNWHLCIPDGLSVVQCSLGHVIGIVLLTQFQWHEAILLDNWQLAVLPQCGGHELHLHRVHDNLSVPFRLYMGFPLSGRQC